MSNKTEILIENIEKIIVGKRTSIEKVLAALLCGGHILIEDVPGVGKTKLYLRWQDRWRASSTEFSSPPTSCPRISSASR